MRKWANHVKKEPVGYYSSEIILCKMTFTETTLYINVTILYIMFINTVFNLPRN